MSINSFGSNILQKTLFNLIVVLIYFLTFFVFLTKFSGSDLKGHNYLLTTYLDAGYFPIPPVYYGLVYLIDLVIRVKYEFVASSVLVLTFFQWWKYRLVYVSFEDLNLGYKPLVIFILSLSFLFLNPIFIPSIDGDLWYLGKFTQTIWHSSTLICSFPLCILLVWRTLKWLKSHKTRELRIMFFLSVVIMLIKPSFLFCYIPALPIFVFLQDNKFSRKLGEAMVLVLVLFALLWIEKFFIFNWDPGIDILYGQNERSEVVLRPMKIWLALSNEPLFDFVTSFPLLIVALVFWPKKIFDFPMFKFSFILLLFAVLVFFLLAETGFREFHANFYWQIPIALFMCNLSVVQFILIQYQKENKILAIKFLVMLFIYCTQVVFGLVFWLRILTDFVHQ